MAKLIMRCSNYSPLFLRLALVIVFGLAPSVNAYAKLSIANVTLNKTSLQAVGDEIRMSFQLGEPAKVELRIYNARDEAVRILSSNGQMAAGDQAFKWDGRDDKGQPVPAEAYFYTLTAANGTQSVVHDLTDITGGETVTVTDISYDSDKGLLSYTLDKPGRVYLRVGIENGFVLRTLLNNEVQTSGQHTLQWDGMGQSGVLSLRDHPRLRFYGSGYRFSRNAIFVQWPNEANVSNVSENENQRPKREAGKRPGGLDRHAYHPVELCRDITLVLELPDIKETDSAGLPIIRGSTPWRVSIKPSDQMLIQSERTEIVFFLGNQLLYENETSYFPYNWHWSSEIFSPGVHHMTAFAVGFKEHFGFTTVKFRVGESNGEDQ